VMKVEMKAALKVGVRVERKVLQKVDR